MPNVNGQRTYLVEFADGLVSESVYGIPTVTDGVLHIVSYVGGGSMPAREDKRVSFPLFNVKSWRAE